MRFVSMILRQIDAIIDSREKFRKELSDDEKQVFEKLRKVCDFLRNDVTLE